MGKKIPMWQTLLVMLAMIGLLMWSIIKDTGGEPHIALVLAASFAGIIAVLNGWKWAYLEQGILASINRSMQAILILAILGSIIASWMAAGTIPSMMSEGIPGNRLYSLQYRIFSDRFVLVNSRFHRCCADGCRYGARFPTGDDSRRGRIRRVFR